MENIQLDNYTYKGHKLSFGLGLLIGIIFGVTLGAIASFSYVTSFASSMSSITHITKNVDQLVSYSYDSYQWDRDAEKLTLKSNTACRIYPGIEEIDLTGYTAQEEKQKMYNGFYATDTIFNNQNNFNQKRVVNFDITPNFSKSGPKETINYTFYLDFTQKSQNGFIDCNNKFEEILKTFILKDVKK